MIPETIPDHELRPGVYLISDSEEFVVIAMNETWINLLPTVGHMFLAKLAALEADMRNNFILMPQATYCIWDTPTCTCGAAHTSFPNQHMRFCGEYK